MSFLQTLIYWTSFAYLGFLLAYGNEIFAGLEFVFDNPVTFLLSAFNVLVGLAQLMLFFCPGCDVPLWLTIILNLAVNVPWILYLVNVARGITTN